MSGGQVNAKPPPLTGVTPGHPKLAAAPVALLPRLGCAASLAGSGCVFLPHPLPDYLMGG
jgi:hypothetical protein